MVSSTTPDQHSDAIVDAGSSEVLITGGGWTNGTFLEEKELTGVKGH